ncbi:MAG: hypothetical protein FWC15_05200 [Fibromonadales bacterium]|nr:hypothetical protein [Fibromonadales bacterium]
MINSEGANENLPFFVWHKEKRSCMQKTECITCGYGKKQVLVDVFKLKLGLGRLTIGLVFAKDDV